LSDSHLFDHVALAAQVKRQRKYAWDLDKGVQWSLGVDTTLPFLPLDSQSIACPGASQEQRLALSQLVGLIINSTISEMESVITKLRRVAWAEPLREFSVNPEMWELGDLFFIEENKHALAFNRFNQLFCQTEGIDPEQLDRLLPKAFGSLFLKAVIANAKSGGHAFWWIVAAVEEVSLSLFQDIHRVRDSIDPLYYEVHKKHMEEEKRHHNYAFLMLELIERRSFSLKRLLHRKTDLLFGQLFSSGWVLGELNKIFLAESMTNDHPFFQVIASCLPLMRQLTIPELMSRLFVSAPYVSLVLNTKNHRLTSRMAITHRAFNFPFPDPNITPLAPPEPTERPLKKKYG